MRGIPLRWGPVLEGSACANVLIECGANVNSQDTNNQTPLHLASANGYLKVAQLLLDHGADVEAQDKYEMTSLHLASQYGHQEIVRLLLHHGANHDAREKNARTALHVVSAELPGYVLCRFRFQFR
jgi:ankyrin repeat protein